MYKKEKRRNGLFPEPGWRKGERVLCLPVVPISRVSIFNPPPNYGSIFTTFSLYIWCGIEWHVGLYSWQFQLGTQDLTFNFDITLFICMH